LTGINAAVVGILLAALVTPVWTSAVATPVDALVAVLVAVAMIGGGLPPVAAVAAAAVVSEALGRVM
jgi:chromate transporter